MSESTGRKSNVETKRNNEIELYLRKIQNEKCIIEKIISQTEAELEQKRRRQLLAASNEAGEQSLTSLKTQIYMLENRLSDALVKFNIKITENKSLRDRIAEKRLERCLYDEIYTKLEREIQLQSQQMRRELEQGKKILELRKQVEQDLSMAKKQLDENNSALELEVAGIEKLRERLKVEVEDARPKTTAVSNSVVTQEVVADNDHNDRIDGKDEIIEEKVMDECLKKVLRLCSIDNVDELIDRLTEIDQQNFSRFHYLAEIEAEVERVQFDIFDATLELERLQNSIYNHQIQQLIGHDLQERKRQELALKADVLERQFESQLDLWQRMRIKIAHVHKALGLPMPNDLLASGGVSESNVFDYLAEIERKTTEIISAFYNDYDDDEGATSPIACRSFTNETMTKATLDLPSVKDAPADEGDRPFTFEELRCSLRA